MKSKKKKEIYAFVDHLTQMLSQLSEDQNEKYS